MTLSRATRAEAAAWLARLKADDRTSRDEAACEAWLARSPDHRRALAEATTAWEIAGAAAMLPPMAPPRRLGRRAVLACGVGGMVGAGLWLAEAPTTYATEIGEMRTLTLKDGSSACLDACSKIRVQIGRDIRRVELVHGRVSVRVAPDPGRPFVVKDDKRLILADAGRIEVSRRAAHTAVFSEDGGAIVRDPGRPPMRLASGERLRETDGRVQTDRPPADVETAWQSGRLVFENQTLSAAVAEINLYNRRAILVKDADTGALRVSGVYKAQDADAFARSVAGLFDLKVLEDDNRLVLAPA